MRISPRIAIPVASAVALAAIIGLTFFWQIQLSISSIESGFRTTVATVSSPVAPVFKNQPATNTIAAGSQAMVFAHQGDVLALGGDWKGAEEKYQAAVDAGGGQTALRSLAKAQMQRREFDTASRTIAAMSHDEPDNDDVKLLAALLLLRMGKVPEAENAFNRMNQTPQGKYGLALIAITREDDNTAKALLTQVVMDADSTLRSYAQALLSAYNEYALFADTQDIHLRTLLARALAQVDECESALPIIGKVVTQRDSYRDAWIVKGFCELSTERTQTAQVSLERAYALDPEKPEIQYFLARTYDALGDSQNAITFLQYAIINGFTPEKDARELLATYALKINNQSLALEQYAAIVSDQPNDFISLDTYVHLALAIPGHAQEAYAAAKNAQTKWPDEPAVLTLVGETAASMGKTDEAKQALEAALRIDPTYHAAQNVLDRLPQIQVQPAIAPTPPASSKPIPVIVQPKK